MAIVYVNMNLSAKNPRSGEYYPIPVGHSAVQAGAVSLAYDNTQITNLAQLRTAVQAALRVAESNAALAKGA